MENAERLIASPPPMAPSGQHELPCISLPILHSGAFTSTSGKPLAPTTPQVCSSDVVMQKLTGAKQSIVLVASHAAKSTNPQQHGLVRGSQAEIRQNRVEKLQPSVVKTFQPNIRDVVHFNIVGSLAGQTNVEAPIIVYEQPSYWVVFKPLKWCLHPSTSTRGDSRSYDYTGEYASESLVTFLRNQSPDGKYPVLSSQQHNFGVVIHLEESWLGLTVVAKSKAAYSDFERLLELQLLRCDLECFVKGPPIRAVAKLYGRTAIGKTQLCIEVIRSTVCRAAGVQGTSPAQEGGRHSSLGFTSDVVSHVILRINFPPILLPDILWCNGLIIASDPYAQKEKELETTGDCFTKLCCFGISFPSFGTINISEESPHQSGGVTKDIKKLPCSEQISLLQILVPSFLIQSAPQPMSCKRVLYAGLLTGLPIALYEILPKVAKWVQNNSACLPVNSVKRTLEKCITGFSAFQQMLVKKNAPFGITLLENREIMYPAPAEVEILFGQAEGGPWLQLLA